MAQTAETIRLATGIPTTVMSDGQLTQIVANAAESVTGKLAAKGASPSGSNYDTAVLYESIIGIRHALDLMGIKPDSLTTAGGTYSTSLAAAIEKLQEQADAHVKAAILAQLGGRGYIRRLWANQVGRS